MGLNIFLSVIYFCIKKVLHVSSRNLNNLEKKNEKEKERVILLFRMSHLPFWFMSLQILFLFFNFRKNTTDKNRAGPNPNKELE